MPRPRSRSALLWILSLLLLAPAALLRAAAAAGRRGGSARARRLGADHRDLRRSREGLQLAQPARLARAVRRVPAPGRGQSGDRRAAGRDPSAGGQQRVLSRAGELQPGQDRRRREPTWGVCSRSIRASRWTATWCRRSSPSCSIASRSRRSAARLHRRSVRRRGRGRSLEGRTRRHPRSAGRDPRRCTITRPGYTSAEQEVTITTSETPTFNVTLERLAAVLTVFTTQEDVEVQLDGKPRGGTAMRSGHRSGAGRSAGDRRPAARHLRARSAQGGLPQLPGPRADRRPARLRGGSDRAAADRRRGGPRRPARRAPRCAPTTSW